MNIKPLSQNARRIEFRRRRWLGSAEMYKAKEFQELAQDFYTFATMTDQHWRGIDQNPVDGAVSLQDFKPRWGSPSPPDNSPTYSAELDVDGYFELNTTRGGKIVAYETKGKFTARADFQSPHNGRDNDSSEYIEVYPDRIVYMSDGLEPVPPSKTDLTS